MHRKIDGEMKIYFRRFRQFFLHCLLRFGAWRLSSLSSLLIFSRGALSGLPVPSCSTKRWQWPHLVFLRLLFLLLLVPANAGDSRSDSMPVARFSRHSVSPTLQTTRRFQAEDGVLVFLTGGISANPWSTWRPWSTTRQHSWTDPLLHTSSFL